MRIIFLLTVIATSQVLYYGVAARSVPGLVQINAQLPVAVQRYLEV